MRLCVELHRIFIKLNQEQGIRKYISKDIAQAIGSVHQNLYTLRVFDYSNLKEMEEVIDFFKQLRYVV